MSSVKSFAETLSGRFQLDFNYVDIGARSGLGAPWAKVREYIRVTSFEPDTEEYKLLLQNKRPQDLLFNAALGERQEARTLRLTKARGSSSLLEPNLELLSHYPNSERYQVEKEVALETVPLDDLHAQGRLPRCDFFKVDVQGLELEIIRGGRRPIDAGCIGMELEIEFAELYRGQPLFPEVHDYATRQLGLQLMDMKRYFWTPKGLEWEYASQGDLIFCDALYLRRADTFMQWLSGFDRAEERTRLLNAVFAACLYGLFHYAGALLLQERKRAVHFTGEEHAELAALIKKYGGRPGPLKGGSFTLSRVLYRLYRKFQSSDRGWGFSDPTLGPTENWGIKQLLE